MLLDQQNALVICRSKLVGPGKHWGVQLPNGQVAHCCSESGVTVTTIDEFAAGRDVGIVREVPSNLHWDVMERLEQALAENRPYHPVSWNCEVFANWLTFAKPESQQVAGALIVAAAAAFIRLAANS